MVNAEKRSFLSWLFWVSLKAVVQEPLMNLKHGMKVIWINRVKSIIVGCRCVFEGLKFEFADGAEWMVWIRNWGWCGFAEGSDNES